MSASGIPNSRNFSGRKTSRGSELRSFGSNIRRSTGVAPGFRHAGQCVLLMVSTRSYMVSPPDAVAAFPSAEAVVRAIGQIDVHGVASRVIVEVVEDQARAFQHGLDPGLYVLLSSLLPLREAAVAGDLVQTIERVRKSAKVGGVLSSITRRELSDGHDVGRQYRLLRVCSHGCCS